MCTMSIPKSGGNAGPLPARNNYSRNIRPVWIRQPTDRLRLFREQHMLLNRSFAVSRSPI
ncbi:hypothetical protein X777_13170 [Ooceraea biroi]|uniref:Uncharacterized protein n=1 Tax=Ooceraea biroi TaxID=2015173 RepID=A0A026VYE1_OOCBI|nr:hypothetical protein X777_13170 [Ooceraea biroi]